MANPEGQTSITGTARLVPATFYIAITPLSGRTTERRFVFTAGVAVRHRGGFSLLTQEVSDPRV
jgi:hypothetical protein